MEIKHVTEDTFEEEVLKADKKVLVDFWADWCMPCRMLGAVLEDVAKCAEDIKICKVDTERSPGLAAQYNIMSIPAIKIFKDGKIVAEHTGFIDQAQMMEFISRC